MDIFFSINNRKTVLQLPIVPSEFKIKSPFNNETWSTINQGDILLIGQRGLKSISFESFFPKKKYKFARTDKYNGWEYAELLETWRDKRIPIRLVITNTKINMLVLIDDFEYGPQDGTGDVYYSISMTEFKEIKLKSKKV